MGPTPQLRVAAPRADARGDLPRQPADRRVLHRGRSLSLGPVRPARGGRGTPDRRAGAPVRMDHRHHRPAGARLRPDSARPAEAGRYGSGPRPRPPVVLERPALRDAARGHGGLAIASHVRLVDRRDDVVCGDGGGGGDAAARTVPGAQPMGGWLVRAGAVPIKPSSSTSSIDRSSAAGSSPERAATISSNCSRATASPRSSRWRQGSPTSSSAGGPATSADPSSPRRSRTSSCSR